MVGDAAVGGGAAGEALALPAHRHDQLLHADLVHAGRQVLVPADHALLSGGDEMAALTPTSLFYVRVKPLPGAWSASKKIMQEQLYHDLCRGCRGGRRGSSALVTSKVATCPVQLGTP